MAKANERELVGRVVARHVGGSSKSARTATVLESNEGDFVLCRSGENPFFDPELERLVGRAIRCRGTVDGYVMTVAEWTDNPDEAASAS